MAGPEFGGPHFPGPFGGGMHGIGHSESMERRGPPSGRLFQGKSFGIPVISSKASKAVLRIAFRISVQNKHAGLDGWGGAERGREPAWDGPEEAGNSWAPREGGPRMPPGNIVSGRGAPLFGEGRGRGTFGRAPPEFAPRGRGGFGRFGRGGRYGDAEFEGGRGWGYNDAQMIEDRPGFGGRSSFRGRGEFGGRGQFGRFGGRFGYEVRRREEEGQRGLDVDPALLERRRASTAALLRRQVSQLQVARDMLREDKTTEDYSRIMEDHDSQTDLAPQADVRGLYTYPMFSAEEIGVVPNPMPTAEQTSYAFEQCLHAYQEAQNNNNVVQSEHGNFLTPML